MPTTKQPGLSADTLLANMPSAMFALDHELGFVWANPAAEQVFQASLNGLRGRSLAQLTSPDNKLIDLARQVLERECTISDYGFELFLARGDVMQVDGHLTPIAEHPGHVLILLHPCSVARRLAAQFSQGGATRSIAAMGAMLAHEVKNPLSGIRGAAQLLEPAADGEDKALVKLICDEADRIVNLVDSMERFAEVGAIRREPVNIHQVLEHVRRLATSGFAREHRFVEIYDPSLPEVEGDRDRLIQLFLNLVKNAAEASAEGRQITLVTQYQHGLRMRVAHSGERIDLPISIEIRDNGPGVRPDIVDHLFEPFVTTKSKGGGLGLALVAKVVGDHGGIVSCVPSDHGAIFRVRLPIASRERKAAFGERT